jgi:hypothetical protein
MREASKVDSLELFQQFEGRNNNCSNPPHHTRLKLMVETLLC